MTAQSKQSLFGCLGLGFLVLVAFAPILANDFVSFDDGTYVTANPHVQTGLTWQGIKWAFQTSTASNWHPLTWLSHMLDCQMFGMRAWGHHLTSVLLHALNTILVFLVFTKITGAAWRSWFMAALFGLHPLRVESVAWVAERKDVLSAFFFVLTIWSYSIYVRERQARSQLTPRLNRGGDVSSPIQQSRSTTGTRTPPPRLQLSEALRGQQESSGGRAGAASFSNARALRFYIIACLFFTLGLLSKQMLVTLPFILLLLDIWPLQRLRALGIGGELNLNPPQAAPKPASSIQRKARLGLLLEKLPFLVLAAFFSLVVYLVQHRAGATGMIGELPLSARAENAVVSYVRYLVKLFWPVNLAVFYPHPGYWPAWVLLSSCAALVGLTACAWLLRRTAPYLLVGWLWYLGSLLPVIGLIQVGRQSMADRYTYLPMIGIAMVLTWGISALASKGRVHKYVLTGAGVAAVVLCIGFTFRQVGFWKDSETLFRHAIEAVPDNYLAHGNLADCLQMQGRLDEAFRELNEALRLKPDDINTRNSYGSVLMQLGRVEEAVGQFQEAIRRWPGFAEAHSNLAFAYQRQGHLEPALAEFQEALKCNPNDFRLHVNLAGLLLKLGRNGEAVGYLRDAVKLEPTDASVRKDLAALLFNAGRLEEAAGQFEAAAASAPDDAEAQANYGICLARLGRTPEAIQHLSEALRIRPEYPEARQELQKLREAVKP